MINDIDEKMTTLLMIVGCGGSVVSSVPSVWKVAGSNSTLAAT